jgi:hypothetical protein
MCQARVSAVQGVPGCVRAVRESDPSLNFFGLGDNHLSDDSRRAFESRLASSGSEKQNRRQSER